MEELATELGSKAGTSAVDSGDYDEYRRDNAEALLAEQYWEAQYGGLLQARLATLSAAARAELASQSDLRADLMARYRVAFAAELEA